jgi:glyoxylase-like metal-dependent hydrolase (beta-lactamase superfamily II)
MDEIAHHIFIETGYAGVTLGTINWPHGLILIDSPFRLEDTRSWRSALQNLGAAVDRLLINLDGHFDRTLGARAMDCTILGHEKMAQVFKNRPVTFKVQASVSGGEWEFYNGLGSIRWAPPEITFSDRLQIHWDNSSLVLESHPGPSSGSIWAILPEERVLFLGDAVVPAQPPFMASADIPAWIVALRLLLAPTYQNYLLVSGRGGLIPQAQVRHQLAFLEKAHQLLDRLAERKAPPEETAGLVPFLMVDFKAPLDRQVLFEQRLRWGLSRYYGRQYHVMNEQLLEE